MKIQILQLTKGAKQATGIAVVIDVFRAFTTACFIMNNGAECIYPVGAVETAFRLKEENPDIILVGERNEIIVPGFDYGNSPANIEHTDFTGKTIVHTTSAGTHGIVNAVNADEIITASFVNAPAVAKYLKEKNPETVSFVCMGKCAVEPAEEDTWCAEYISSLITGTPYNVEERLKELRNLEGRRFFRPDNQLQCPERDFYLATQIGLFDFVLKAECIDKAVPLYRLNFANKTR